MREPLIRLDAEGRVVPGGRRLVLDALDGNLTLILIGVLVFVAVAGSFEMPGGDKD